MTRAASILALMTIAHLASAQTFFMRSSARRDSVRIRSISLRGQADAVRDTTAGIIKLKYFGLPDPSDGNYAYLLERKYGVVVEFVGADLFDPEEFAYWSSYNAVSNVCIRKRYGKAIFDSVETEARALFKRGTDFGDSIRVSNGPQPYHIEAPKPPEFCDSLVVPGTFGTVYLSLQIPRNAKSPIPTINGFNFFQGPFLPDLTSYCEGNHSSKYDRLLAYLKGWAAEYFSRARFYIDSTDFHWMYKDTLEIGYNVEIHSARADRDPVKVTIPNVSPPPSLVGPNDQCEVFCLIWVDRFGKIFYSRIEQISWTKALNQKDGADGRFKHFFVSSSTHTDTAASYTGDIALLDRFKPWFDTIIPHVQFEVDTSGAYFKHFPFARTLVGISNTMRNPGN